MVEPGPYKPGLGQGVVENWSDGESETQCYTVRTEQENMLGYLNYFSRFKPSTLAQTWFAERRSRDPLPKYYSDRGVFQVFRAKAGSTTPPLHVDRTDYLL